MSPFSFLCGILKNPTHRNIEYIGGCQRQRVEGEGMGEYSQS